MGLSEEKIVDELVQIICQERKVYIKLYIVLSLLV